MRKSTLKYPLRFDSIVFTFQVLSQIYNTSSYSDIPVLSVSTKIALKKLEQLYGNFIVI